MVAQLNLIILFVPAILCGNYYRERDVWVANIEGDVADVDRIAAKYGFKVISQLDSDERLFLLKKNLMNAPSFRNDVEGIGHESSVRWIEKQIPVKRSKRQFSWFDSRYSNEFNDALWFRQWYMQDYRNDTSQPVMGMNVVPAYHDGITGKGVRIAVVDDGLERNHRDLKDNFDPEISFNYVENNTDPTPIDSSSSHGTQCAGVIAMVANNKLCGVGVAYNARIGGIRLLDGDVTDLLESKALSHRQDKVDIYSCSWGPDDNGETMAAPGKQSQSAMLKGVVNGRGGKGTIYVFAGGNGKLQGDNCGADGFVNSLFTIPIASASQEGKAVWYGERCSAIMATAYSSGSFWTEKVASTGLKNSCTTDFIGTSAATPLAAGIIALALEANTNLTWRDVQHLIAWTSEVTPLSYNKDWILNGMKFWVSPDFGFGLLNGHAMVKSAKEWRTVPQLYSCRMSLFLLGNMNLTKGRTVDVKFATTGCRGSKSEIRYLEHVQLTALVPFSQRGALYLTLTSPSGTKSLLLEDRPRDRNSKGALVQSEWTMDSIQFWGENPVGVWIFSVTAKDNQREEYEDPTGFKEVLVGKVSKVRVVLYGTKEMPQHYKDGARNYGLRNGWGPKRKLSR